MTALQGVRRAWHAHARRATEAQWADDVALVRRTAGELQWAPAIGVFAEQCLSGRLDQWTQVFTRVMMPVAADVAARVAPTFSVHTATDTRAALAPDTACRDLLQTWVPPLARGRAERTVTMLLKGLRRRLAIASAIGAVDADPIGTVHAASLTDDGMS